MDVKDSISAKRQYLRKQVRELRSAQEPSGVAQKSGLICSNLRQIPELQNAATIMAYAAINQEADVNRFWEKEWRAGKIIVLPRVNGGRLEVVKFCGWGQTRSGPFGIREPEGEPFPPDRIEAVLVPGVVFDRKGYRLGYGKGYYDRFLPLLIPTAFFCGIAYDLQLVNDTFPTNQDVAVHAVVTESRIIRFI